MRNAILAALALSGVAFLCVGSAEARTYRYCMVEGGWRSSGPGTCYYDTYAQCMASASGIRAYCQVNPFYAFAEKPQRRPRRVYREY